MKLALSNIKNLHEGQHVQRLITNQQSIKTGRPLNFGIKDELSNIFKSHFVFVWDG